MLNKHLYRYYVVNFFWLHNLTIDDMSLTTMMLILLMLIYELIIKGTKWKQKRGKNRFRQKIFFIRIRFKFWFCLTFREKNDFSSFLNFFLIHCISKWKCIENWNLIQILESDDYFIFLTFSNSSRKEKRSGFNVIRYI